MERYVWTYKINQCFHAWQCDYLDSHPGVNHNATFYDIPEREIGIRVRSNRSAVEYEVLDEGKYAMFLLRYM